MEKGNIRLGLHDMVIAQPAQVVVSLIDTARVKADGLVVADIAQALAAGVAHEELRVEAPGDDRLRDDLVVAVDVDTLGHVKESLVAALAGEPQPFQRLPLVLGELKEA